MTWYDPDFADPNIYLAQNFCPNHIINGQCKQYHAAKTALDQIEFLYWSVLADEPSLAQTLPIFRTAPLLSWLEWSTKLMSMFTSDLTLKRTIVTEISRVPADQRKTLLLYLNAWLSSPLIDSTLFTTITTMANSELEEVTDIVTSRSGASTPSRSPSAKSSPHKAGKKSAGKTPSPRPKK